MRHNHLALLMALPLLLLGCGGPKEKIGSTDTKGKSRVAAFQLAEDKKESTGVFVPDFNFGLPSPNLNKDWPMAGYNAGHNPQNLAFTQKPTVIWTASIGTGSDNTGKILTQPIVVSGHVYTLDAAGLVSCFSASNGDRLWQLDTNPKDNDGLAGGGLASDGQNVYVATGFGEVLALSAQDGKIVWRRSLQNPLRSAPTLSGNRLFVISIDNLVSALDSQSGQILWQYRSVIENATLMGAASPALAESGVIAGTSAGDVVNLRPENGRLSWGFSLASNNAANSMLSISDIRGMPVVDQGSVIAISHAGRMAMIDARSGEQRWEVAAGGQQTPLVIGNTIYVLDSQNQLRAISRDQGQPIWTRQLQRHQDEKDANSDPILWAGPVMADGTLWLVNSLGDLVAFSPTDGNQRTVLQLDKAFFVSPVLADRTLYVVSDDGTLMALR